MPGAAIEKFPSYLRFAKIAKLSHVQNGPQRGIAYDERKPAKARRRRPEARRRWAAMKKKVTIGSIQTRASENVAENLSKTVQMVRRAARRGARIICLQELYRSLYFPQQARRNREAMAESIPGQSTNVFGELARELGVVIIVPIFERTPGGKFYNSAVVIDHRGKLLPTYRKMHIPQDPLFYEKSYFQPGDQGWQVYQTKFATFAVLICYDQWFPEAARAATLAGAEIIFYPTAIGNVVGYRSADGDWHDAWETVMRGHAIANGVHVVAVNRVGREDRLRFWGQSFACDSFGKILKRASAAREEVMIAKLDLSHNKRIREGWGFLRNRRPDAYREKSIRAATVKERSPRQRRVPSGE
jgi:agmatine deiminase